MEQIKKYIRGNKERGYGVIAELEKLGGKNILKLKGDEYDKVYYIERYKYTNANTIDFVSQKSFIGQLIVTHPDWEEIELPEYKYPKTYEECCKILGCKPIVGFAGLDDDEENLYVKFIALKRCRDAYWKLYGEEMGLGKSWEPDWDGFSEDSYPTITKCNNRIIKTSIYTYDCILAFPTEEMQDYFYTNFKQLIEQCKELL